MLRIQTKAIDLPDLVPADDRLKQWQDLENMPELHTREEAEAWLEQSALQTLKDLGFEFQIVPSIEDPADSCALCGKPHRDHVIINMGHMFTIKPQSA